MKSSESVRRSLRTATLACIAAAMFGLAHAQAPLPAPLLADVIQSGDRAAALALIAAGADVNAAQPDGATPLLWASYRVDPALAKLLLAKGAKADVSNRYGASPLTEAVKVANLELVMMLLKAGANVEAANEDGQTALMLAARVGSLPVAKQLVRRNARVDARETWRGQTALMWAAAENHPEVVEYLVSRGADVNTRAVINDWPTQITSEPRAQYRPTGGLTPFLYAVRAGCDRCVRAMLKAGADIDRPTPDGVSPLMAAIDNMNYDVARLLLEKGANPHVWDWWGRTALYIAVDVRSVNARGSGGVVSEDRTSSTELMRLLLAAGVNRNPQLDMHRPGRAGNSGRFTDDLLTAGATPLLRAAIAFDNEAIELLLANGALIDLPNVMGVTPLMAVAGLGVSIRDTRGNYTTADIQTRVRRTLEILLAAGGDINATVLDTSGRTARIARPSTMTNRQGQTALYGAINWGWTDVVRFLLAHGARVDVADALGKTPVDAAKGNAGGRDYRKVDEVMALIGSASAGKVSQQAPPPTPTANR